MKEHGQSVDVCVVCALPEEARAVLAVLPTHGTGPIEEQTSPRYGYSSRLTTITNDQGEPLTLHLSWLPHYGPAEMTLHLSHVLEEYHPRLAVMTGICAGDAARVQLGDLVVAERTFTYDNGKYTLDEQGRSVHEHDSLTYQLDANLLQFLGLFDAWQPLVARLKRPMSPPELRKRKVACHFKAMASGSAVRADQPFEEVRAPVRGTVAIDMEGAAFGLVMSRHPHIPWLIVKGVSDYADQTKNDAYHGFAARASALYALSFLRAYLTAERLPPWEGPSSSSQAGLSKVWNVPFARSPYFTGRDDLLERLDQQLTPTEQKEARETRRAALTQPQAIKGLGGIGKTQIAVEYAYRARSRGRYTHTLWVNAASEETIIASYMEIAQLLPSFVSKNETDQRQLAEAVKRWLEQCEQPWLLIFDNADNADDLPVIQAYFPQGGKGSILLTTRASAVGSLAASIEVGTMGLMEGAQLLLRRAQRQDHASDEAINDAINVVIALDHFPLAIDQAGAYIEETGCDLDDYLQLYHTHRKELLARRGLQTTNYPDSVATTWSLSFQKVEQQSPAAGELLRLCAFLAPDRIPEEFIIDCAAQWSSPLQQAAVDRFTFNQMIEELLKFSLVKRLAEAHMLSIHRLVQAVLVDTMELETQRHWAERVVRAVNQVFPVSPEDLATWPQCLRYLDQAQTCDDLIRQYLFSFTEAAGLLQRTATYLTEHASYNVAEPLYQRALAIWEQRLGPQRSEAASALNGLATLYREQGKYAEAEPLYLQALCLWEQDLGLEHPRVAYALHGLALQYRMQGRYAEAEPLYQRALAIWEKNLGPEHPQVAYPLAELETLYREQGKSAQAELFHQRKLRIWDQCLGPEQPEVAYSLNGLATLYNKA
jgi:nucleoside phosphorylase